MNAILTYAIEHAADLFLEPALNLCNALIAHDAVCLADKLPGLQHVNPDEECKRCSASFFPCRAWALPGAAAVC